jgi:GTP-binding protein
VIIEATFVRSAAGARDFPRDGLAEIALVGRSNVGKSSLINALIRQRIARTSAAPGKTRLANLYRIARASSGAGRAGDPFYLVDLPGYGYARGRDAAAREFEELTRAYFGRAGRAGQAGGFRIHPPALPAPSALPAALLVVDARHPGLESDGEAWRWLAQTVADRAIVATKVDKLSRGERIRALRLFESVFEHPVVPVSAVTGEGMDELWKVIEQLRNSSSSNSSRPQAHSRRSPRPSTSSRRRATVRPALPRRKN